MYQHLKVGPCFPNTWNICQVVDEANKPTIFIAVRGEMESKEAHALFQRLVNQEGRKVIGLSSYQNFPQRTCNPFQNADYPRKKEELFINRYGHYVILWCHCFRYPNHYIPTQSIPLLLFSESDQYSYTTALYSYTTNNNRDNCVKQYDFFVSVPEGQWNSWIRRLDICQKWLNYLADEMHLKILVCGTKRRSDFSANIDVIDFQPWQQFVQAMNKCKYLFNAATHDASPRILIEAIALNMPILVNEQILGGWKYINKYTGAFFCPTEEIKPQIEHFLSTVVPTCMPRQWFQHHFNAEQNTQGLADTLNILSSFQWQEVVDAVLYINLEKRTDRREALLKELDRMDFPAELVHRINATEDKRCGHLGCVDSHLRAIAYALDKGFKRVLILEDDFQFVLAKERILYMLQTFLAAQENRWDVLMFANGHLEYEDKTELGFIRRLKYCTTAAGYLVNGAAYLRKLQANFRESRQKLAKEVAEKIQTLKMKRIYESSLALDQYWSTLQAQDRFYTFDPVIGKQSGSISSIMV